MPKTKLLLNMVCSDTNDGACAHQNMSKNKLLWHTYVNFAAILENKTQYITIFIWT